MFTMVSAVMLDCPRGDPADPCRIPLPYQNLVGMCDGPRELPLGTWPAVFFCMKHAHTCVRSPRNIELEEEIEVPDEPMPSLWRIECECAHENCGKRHAVYTSRAPDWETIERVILLRNPSVACDGHELVWSKELMRGTEIAHDSFVR
jgi:hypothetical protein